MLGYISVKKSIKRLKNAYVGIKSNKTFETEILTIETIRNYFNVSYPNTYTFNDKNKNGVFKSTNVSRHSSTASIKLTAKQDIKKITFNYFSSSESSYDYLRVYYNDELQIEQSGTNRTETTYFKHNMKKDDYFIFYYSKDSSVHSGSDFAQFSDLKIIVDTGEIDDYAKRIYKIYVGSKDNKAKLLWEPGKIWHKTLQSFNTLSDEICGTAQENYALFTGTPKYSENTSEANDIVEVYNKYLSKIDNIKLSTARSDLGCTTVSNKSFFAGGYIGSSTSNIVDIYDEELSCSTKSMLYSRRRPATAAAKDLIIFAAGTKASNSTGYYSVSCMDSDTYTTKELSANSYMSGRYVIGASFKNVAVFSGMSSRTFATVYDSDGIYQTAISLPNAVYEHTSTSMDDFLFFVGGGSSTKSAARVTCLNTNHTTTELESLTTNRNNHSASVVTDGIAKYLLIGGGQTTGSNITSVEIYDNNLTKIDSSKYNLDDPHVKGVSVAINNKAFFAGGVFNSVECFIV